MKAKKPSKVRNFFSLLKRLNSTLYRKVNKSIRLELLLVFGVCLLIALMASSAVDSFYQRNRKIARIDYSIDSKRILEEGRNIADNIQDLELSIKDKKEIQEFLNGISQDSSYKIVISDLDGKVLYKSTNANETQVDIYNTIKNTMEAAKDIEFPYGRKEVMSFYPISFTDGRGYVIVSGMPEGRIIYDTVTNGLPGTAALLITFLLSFYFITNSKMRYIEHVSKGLLEISKGNLDYRIKRHGDDELTSLADNINTMAQELKNQIESERMAEKSKNELITNVSHDLRTPLTSIKGYLGLIKEKRYKEEKELEQYVNIAYNKAEKLEGLINDLFEYTKLTKGGVVLEKEKIILNGLLEQLIEELVPISEENNIVIKQEFINEKIAVNIDANKTVRVFDNLFMNAIRYSLKPGEIKAILKKEEDFAVVVIENKCEDLTSEDLSKLFSRFYRVEKSRSSDTGGSGLGLAIAKNIVELQEGSIKAEYKEGIISFIVKFKLYKEV